MEFVILGFFTACGKLAVLWKVLGKHRLVRWEKWLDLFFAILLPLLFIGTFSGALLAVFSGLWLSLFLRVIAFFVKPRDPMEELLLKQRLNNRNRRRSRFLP